MQHTMMVRLTRPGAKTKLTGRECYGGLEVCSGSFCPDKASDPSSPPSCEWRVISTLKRVSDTSIIMTGWGMSAHEQALMISSKVSCPCTTRHLDSL
jgi:hypothetical protein